MTVTIRGTGFFAGGAQQTRVKIAGSEGCEISGSSDVSTVAGGGGRVCDTIYWTQADQLQSCEVWTGSREPSLSARVFYRVVN